MLVGSWLAWLATVRRAAHYLSGAEATIFAWVGTAPCTSGAAAGTASSIVPASTRMTARTNFDFMPSILAPAVDRCRGLGSRRGSGGTWLTSENGDLFGSFFSF